MEEFQTAAPTHFANVPGDDGQERRFLVPCGSLFCSEGICSRERRILEGGKHPAITSQGYMNTDLTHPG